MQRTTIVEQFIRLVIKFQKACKKTIIKFRKRNNSFLKCNFSLIESCNIMWLNINMSFSTGQFPTEWKKSKVAPIYKNGPKSNIENYRPISVIPAISKVIEKIVHSQLYGYMEQNNLLCDQQFGFRKKRSTEIAATLFFGDIKQYVNDNGLAGAIFIDLCKAFDTIGHARLLEKLKLYGVRDTEHSWFTDYLFNREIYVNYAGILSNPEPVFNGVPQGSILGLFVVYHLF